MSYFLRELWRFSTYFLKKMTVIKHKTFIYYVGEMARQIFGNSKLMKTDSGIVSLNFSAKPY